MAARDHVGYDYLAAGLGVTIETIRIYRLRHKDFPTPVNPGQRSPLFARVAADRYITAHRRTDAPATTTPPPLKIDMTKVVDFAYIANGLKISLKTAYKYGTPTSSRHLPSFPNPINPGSRSPLFNKLEADVFIAGRLAAADNQKGRVRAAAINDTALAAAAEVARMVGREVDLESRVQLQELLFGELGLPATSLTSRGPSVSTSELLQLQQSNPNEVLRQILVYRGALPSEDAR